MTRRCCVAFLGLVFLMGAPALRAAPQSLVSMLPSDTVVVVQAPNLGSFVEKVKSSPLGKIADLPDVAPMVAMMKQMVTMMRAQVRSEAGFDPWDIITSLQGEVVLAYGSLQPLEKAMTDQLVGLPPSVTSESISLLLSIDAGPSKAKLKGALDKILAMGKSHGARVDSSDFYGGKLTTIKPPPEEADKEFAGLYLAEKDTRFVLGFNKKFIEQVLSGSVKTGLANDTNFKSTFKLSGEGSDVFVFVNVKSLTDSIDRALSATFFGFFWQKFQTLVFGRSLNNLGIGAGIDQRGISQRVFVHNGGAEDGVLGWLKAPAIDARPPAFTPENANMATSMSIDVGKIFGFFQDLAQTAMSVRGGGDINMMFEQQFGVRLDDLKRSFGTRVDAFSTSAGDLENPFGDATLMIGLKDPKPMRDLLKKVNAIAPGTLNPEQYQGHELLLIAAPGAPVDPAVCVTGKALIVSVKSDNVRKVIRRMNSSSSPLADSARFKKAAGASPSKVNYFGYQSIDYNKEIEEMYSDLIEQFMSMQGGGGAGLPPNMDKALLSVLKGFTQSFGDSFAYGAWKAEGFHVEGMTPFK